MAAEEAEKIAAAEKNPKKRKRTKTATATEETRSNLPEDLWEHIFKFLNDEDNNTFNLLRPDGNLGFTDRPRRIRTLYHVSKQDLPITNSSFRSLSLVSKQFLSITNRLRFLVKISEATIPFLNRLFERFPNITSLNITLSPDAWSGRVADLGEFLAKISTSPLDLKSLTLYHPDRVPENEFRALSKKMKNLTSLTCYQMRFINKNDLNIIADCFPSLEELILTDTGCPHNCAIDSDDQFLALPKLRRIALTHNNVCGHSTKNLCKNCDLLQEVKVVGGCVARYAFGGPCPPLQYQ
jgi:hypothetical protein